jgi:hypothetical protein
MAIQAFPTPPHHLRETKEEKKREKKKKTKTTIRAAEIFAPPVVANIKNRNKRELFAPSSRPPRTWPQPRNNKDKRAQTETSSQIRARKKTPTYERRSPNRFPTSTLINERRRTSPKRKNPEEEGPRKTHNNTKENHHHDERGTSKPHFPFLCFSLFSNFHLFFFLLQQQKNSQPLFFFWEFLFNALVSPNCF